MNTILEKLDRQAGCWLESLDRGLQQPLYRAITGQVFNGVGSANGRKEPNTARHTTRIISKTQELSVYTSSIPAELKRQECGDAA